MTRLRSVNRSYGANRSDGVTGFSMWERRKSRGRRGEWNIKAVEAGDFGTTCCWRKDPGDVAFRNLQDLVLNQVFEK